MPLPLGSQSLDRPLGPPPLGPPPAGRTRGAALVAALLLLLAGVSGCTKKPSTANLPAGGELVSAAATAMREVQTAHVVIAADGQVADLPVKRADGILTKSGDAKGSIQIEQLGALIEYQFVVVGDKIYLKGVTGGWQSLPLSVASSIYDPSAILDPERGVAKVLGTATEAKTEAQEKVDGQDTYRVGVKLDRAAVAQLVPGVGDGVTGQLWLETATKHLVKAVLRVPAANGGSGGTVTINVSDINAPVSISAP